MAAAAVTPDAGNPVTWLTSLGMFLPVAGVLFYLFTTVRDERDRYRSIVLEMLPEYRDAMQKAAIAQERMADMVESRMLSEEELRRLRRILERLGGRSRQQQTSAEVER